MKEIRVINSLDSFEFNQILNERLRDSWIVTQPIQLDTSPIPDRKPKGFWTVISREVIGCRTYTYSPPTNPEHYYLMAIKTLKAHFGYTLVKSKAIVDEGTFTIDADDSKLDAFEANGAFNSCFKKAD